MSNIKYIEVFSKAGDWLDSNYEEIRKKYQNKFIAIKGNKIIATSDDMDSLIDRLVSMGEDLNTVLIEFIPGEGTKFIL